MTEHWNEFLEHKGGYKYVKRWRGKNGKWQYQYPEDERIINESGEGVNKTGKAILKAKDEIKKYDQQYASDRENPVYKGKVASASRRIGRAEELYRGYNDSFRRLFFEDITDSKRPKDLKIKSSAAVKKKAKKGKRWLSNLFK